LAGMIFITSVHCPALTDPELIAIRQGFDARRDALFAAESGKPLVPAPIQYDRWGPGVHYSRAYGFSIVDFAIRAFWLQEQLAEANAGLQEMCQFYLDNPLTMFNRDSFHWTGSELCRIYEFFGHDGSRTPGLLTAQTESIIFEMMWQWAKQVSRISNTEILNSQTWYIKESENHDAMGDMTAWGFAKILKDNAPYNGYLYDDGFSAQQHFEAWTEYLKEYLRERAKKGLLVEIASPGYGPCTLKGWYNLYDFAHDEILRNRARMLIDLWWTDWAHDQVGAVRGGSKARCYQGGNSKTGKDASYQIANYYFGFDPAVFSVYRIFLTSEYRLPLVVMDIALDKYGKGVYLYKSRRPGLNLLPKPPEAGSDYALNPDYGGIYRYTYSTPDFVMGTSMLAKRARIYPQCVGLGNGKTYNQQWSIQNKGTLIAQKLTTSKQAGDMRVWFSGPSTGMTLTEEGGWVFAQTYSAYAAVRPAWGGYSWDDQNWLRCSDEWAPVIIEVARVSDYGDLFAWFKSAVLNQTIDVNAGVLTYTGLGGSGTFTFYTESSQTPELNGVPIDFEPDYTFDSPFMHEDWASGVVTISKDQRELVLDFNPPPSCGDWGYFAGDIDQDCYVGANDLAILAQQFIKPAPTSTYLAGDTMVVMEAEHYAEKTDGNGPLCGHSWVDLSGVGSMGDGYLQVLPDENASGGSIEENFPRLRYSVRFLTSGAYYLWVKGWGDDANADSVHYGLDGVCISTGYDDCAAVPRAGEFRWQSSSGSGIRPVITVNSTGLHYVDIWMREDGCKVDRLLLTTEQNYNPEQNEPAESSFAVTGDLDDDGQVNLVDFAILAGDWSCCSDPQVAGCINLQEQMCGPMQIVP